MDEKIFEKVKEVRDKAFYDATILVRQFKWNQRLDLRVRSLSKLIHILIGLHLACHTLIHLPQESSEYWSKLKLPLNGNENIKGYIDSFEMFVKVGFCATLFSITESTLRAYLCHLDPQQYEKNLMRTEKIIRILLLKTLERKYIYGLQWVDLLRNIRNTLHYNGVFTPQDGKPFSITYREKKYEFIPGESINFVDWYLLLNLADDLRGLFFHISTDGKIRTQEFISDPSQIQAT